MEDGWTVIVSELNIVKNNAIIDSNEENCMSSNMCLLALHIIQRSNLYPFMTLLIYVINNIRILAYNYTCSTCTAVEFAFMDP